MDKNPKKTPLHDLEQDTPALAMCVSRGMNSRHVLHKKGDIRRILDRVKSRIQKQIDP
jgi:hypothetical protein